MSSSKVSGSGAGDSPDAAGGEAVFSSDGLPPLPAPPPPIPMPDRSGPQDDGIDLGAVSPDRAFEVFSGRVYLNNERVRTGRGAPPAASSSAGRGVAAESPLVRLARLSAEVKELEAELATSSPIPPDAAAGAGVELEPDELTRLARDLSSRLNVAACKAGIAGGDAAAAVRGRNTQLTVLVRKELERIAEEEKGKGDSSPSEKGGVVYELYSGGASSVIGERTAPSDTALEERLLRIENAIGSSSSSGGGKTVLQRLEEAEKSASAADDKKLEKAAARAKVIRADLEAAAKARSKLSSSLSSLPAEDAAAISALHEQLLDLEGVSAHLPAIVSRLGELSELHTQAADFSTRLSAVEGATDETERLLRGVEEAIERVESGWKSNLEAVERSVAKIDERVGSISR